MLVAVIINGLSVLVPAAMAASIGGIPLAAFVTGLVIGGSYLIAAFTGVPVWTMPI